VNRLSNDLEEASLGLLASAQEILAGAGENQDSMREIGRLMLNLSSSRVIEEMIGTHPGSEPAVVDLLGADQSGSKLLMYRMDRWQSPAVTDAHWHNYWQSLLVVRGDWEDTVWRPVAGISDGAAESVTIDRHEAIRAGEVQVLGPEEPHGWEASEARRADGVVLLMWAGSAKGKPRMVLRPETGSVSEEYGHLNPRPKAAR
jgi:hypothetical protein